MSALGMGWRVTIKGENSELVTRLRTDPAEVFGRPYAGYLLFLIGQGDSEALAWLREHLHALDSLTGPHVAFAVFVKELRLQVNVVPRPSPSEAEAVLTRNVSLRDLRRATETQYDAHRLMESGFLKDDDFVVATTYAVDEIARTLGIIRDLPCIAALDATPRDSMELIRLADVPLDAMVPFLRNVISDLTDNPRFSEYIGLIERLPSFRDQTLSRNASLADVESKIAALAKDAENLEEKVDTFLASVRQIVKDASVGQLRALFNVHRTPMNAEVLARAKDRQDDLRSLNSTISALAAYASRDWPLGPDDLVRYVNVYSAHCRRLLPALPVQPVISSAGQCREILAQLIEDQALLLEILLAPLRPADVREAFRASNHESIASLEHAAGRVRGVLSEIATAQAAIIRDAASAEMPSLTEVVRREARRRKITSASRRLGAAGARMVNPQLVGKAIDLLQDIIK